MWERLYGMTAGLNDLEARLGLDDGLDIHNFGWNFGSLGLAQSSTDS